MSRTPQTRLGRRLVVGGGIIGLVTAWRAAQRGLAHRPSWTPSRAAAPRRSRPGCWPPSPNCTTASRPCSASTWRPPRRYPDFVAELDRGDRPATSATARCGTLAVALDADDRARSARTARPATAVRPGVGVAHRAASAGAWSRCSRRACAAGCGWTATTRSIRGGWPRPWWTACERAGVVLPPDLGRAARRTAGPGRRRSGLADGDELAAGSDRAGRGQPQRAARGGPGGRPAARTAREGAGAAADRADAVRARS